MDSREENALVRKLARGDEAAWEAFCGEYSAALVQFVRLAFGCGREKSEEIVQMTFVRCVRSIGTFDPARGRLFPWLKAVARNEARSCLRGELRGGVELPLSAVPEHVLDRLADAIDRTPLPDELLAQEETQMLIRECLTELNARYRQVLRWKYVEERPFSFRRFALERTRRLSFRCFASERTPWLSFRCFASERTPWTLCVRMCDAKRHGDPFPREAWAREVVTLPPGKE